MNYQDKFTMEVEFELKWQVTDVKRYPEAYDKRYWCDNITTNEKSRCCNNRKTQDFQWELITENDKALLFRNKINGEKNK